MRPEAVALSTPWWAMQRGRRGLLCVAWGIVLLSMGGAVARAGEADYRQLPAQQAKPEAEKDLQSLRQQINTLRQELRGTEVNRNEAVDALQRSEQAISTINRELGDLAQKCKLAEHELTRISEQLASLRSARDDTRIHFARLLRIYYQQGEHSALRLLLNHEDPGQTQRNLRYYRYWLAAVEDQSKKYTQQIAQWHALQSRQQQQKDTIVGLLATTQQKQGQLREEQGKRKLALDEVSGQLQTQRQRVNELEANARQLSRLVEQLNRIIQQEEEVRRERLRREREAQRKRGKPAAPMPRPDDDDSTFARSKGRYRMPLPGTVSERFGTLDAEGLRRNGIFIQGERNAPVKVIAEGKVVFADWMRGFGNIVIVNHHGGYLSLYGAGEAIIRQVGDTVKAGETIALAGNSGGKPQTGVYFEIRHLGQPVDPLPWVR